MLQMVLMKYIILNLALFYSSEYAMCTYTYLHTRVYICLYVLDVSI
jgi:hypothetical protein